MNVREEELSGNNDTCCCVELGAEGCAGQCVCREVAVANDKKNKASTATTATMPYNKNNADRASQVNYTALIC